MARRSIASLIDSWIVYKDERNRPCALLVLMHQNGNKAVEIAKFPIGSARPSTGEEIWGYFKGRAETHAQELPGIQYYNILALCEGSQEPFSQQSFKEGGAEDSHGLATEGPTPTGIVQQMMRHTEAMARTSTQFSGELFTHMTNMIGRLTDQNEKLMDRHTEVLDLAEKILLERASDTFKKEIEIRTHDRNTKLMTEFMEVAPALINTVTGKEVFPQSSADKVLIDKLADSLTVDQVQGLSMLGLPPELTGLVMARLEKRMKEQREAKALAVRGPNGTSE